MYGVSVWYDYIILFSVSVSTHGPSHPSPPSIIHGYKGVTYFPPFSIFLLSFFFSFFFITTNTLILVVCQTPQTNTTIAIAIVIAIAIAIALSISHSHLTSSLSPPILHSVQATFLPPSFVFYISIPSSVTPSLDILIYYTPSFSQLSTFVLLLFVYARRFLSNDSSPKRKNSTQCKYFPLRTKTLGMSMIDVFCAQCSLLAMGSV